MPPRDLVSWLVGHVVFVTVICGAKAELVAVWRGKVEESRALDPPSPPTKERAFAAYLNTLGLFKARTLHI